jgi:hypothetical protein
MTETIPNNNEEIKYAVLAETNGEEFETWYYFIKYNGNEDALKHLQEQLEKVDMYILDDYSTFDLDLEHLVSATTAKEMSKIEVNSVMYHRKFDGTLQFIKFGIKSKDKNTKRIKKINEKIGMGNIDEYIDKEDIDPEDLIEGESDEDDTSSEEESSEEESSEEESSEEDSNLPVKNVSKLIPAQKVGGQRRKKH